MTKTDQTKRKHDTGMPKWLLYGLIAKGVAVTLIVVAVLWYARAF